MRKNIQKSLSILLSLVLALSVFGCLSLTAFAEGEKWAIAELQTGDAHATATIADGTLTYTNATADYVPDGRDGINRGASGWWFGARFNLSDASIKEAGKVKINTRVYNVADVCGDDSFFDLWAFVNEEKVAAALEGDKKITYTVSFFNAGDETADPDQVLYLVVDVNNIVLTTGEEITLKVENGAVVDPDAEDPGTEDEAKPAKENFLAKLQKFFKKLLAIAKKLTKILEAFTSKAEETA